MLVLGCVGSRVCFFEEDEGCVGSRGSAVFWFWRFWGVFVLEVLEWDGSHLQGSSRKAGDCPILGLCDGGHVHIPAARRVDDVNDLRLSLCCDLEGTDSKMGLLYTLL